MLNRINNTISFSFLQKFPELIMVMSSRKIGNLNIGKMSFSNAKKLLDKFNINTSQLVVMEQIHSNKINIVNAEDGGSVIPNVDGLLTNCKNLYLGVKTADCVPIFFYVPIKKIIGIVHAGWKSTVGRISCKMINKIISFGVDVKDIYVLIGPHIQVCCYQVDQTRIDLFDRIFRTNKIFEHRSNNNYLDLGKANKIDLIKSGVLDSHIEYETECTSCKNEEYFSYRKDTKETFGEMLSIIGIKE